MLQGVDPQKARVEALSQTPAEPAITFGKFATDLIDSIEEGFTNPKHR